MDESDRHNLTFEQAEGRTPLPRQLALREMPPELVAPLWGYVHSSMIAARSYQEYADDVIGPPWAGILRSWHIYHQHGMADEFSKNFEVSIRRVKAIFASGDYVSILGFIQFVLRHPERPAQFVSTIDVILRRVHAAYRVLDRRTIVPVASDEEAVAVATAFKTLAGSQYSGAKAHLQRAAEELTAGRYGDSVRESVHAVEAVARGLEPSAATLSPALAKLEKAGKMHPALKRGLSALYGYASDEKGVRHALVDTPGAAVDEAEAMYMFGACAAFVTFLIQKDKGAQRAAG